MIADMLSRTVYHNRTRLDPAALLQSRRSFDFDLYGNATCSLAPRYPTHLSYRPRRLADCPRHALSVAVPPWQHLLSVVSEAAQGKTAGRTLLVLPLWPSQPWWPLVVRLARGLLWTFKGTPWIASNGRRLPYQAVGLWVGDPS